MDLSKSKDSQTSQSGRRFNKVIVFSGHMIDLPGRKEPRFPAIKEKRVRDLMAEQLDVWKVGAGDLAICGGTPGGDILFAELCAERDAIIWLFISMPEPSFLDKPIRLPESDWEQRYFVLRERPQVSLFFQHEQIAPPSEGASVFENNNLWIIDAACREAASNDLYAMLVWDEKPTGDGSGGTSDFAARIKRLGSHLAIINPTRL